MLLDGKELAGYIKERQAGQVRRLRGKKIFPKLAIVLAGDDAPSQTYTRLKQGYGQDIGIEVHIHKTESTQLISKIKMLGADKEVDGIIVQLPLPEGVDTQEVLDAVVPSKDIDGLGSQSKFTPATPTAILWLLAGYNVDLKDKQIAIIGQGRLVGKPLYKILRPTHKSLHAYDEHTKDLSSKIRGADIIISATGQPELVKPQWLKPKAVVIDAGTAFVGGKLVGDVAPEVYERSDVKVSPVPGGVGPLTVCALFENLLAAVLE